MLEGKQAETLFQRGLETCRQLLTLLTLVLGHW